MGDYATMAAGRLGSWSARNDIQDYVTMTPPTDGSLSDSVGEDELNVIGHITNGGSVTH